MVSVIIPVYNSAHLDDTMRSVLSQTCRDIEVICIDDGSSDGSGDELRRWTEKDARVRVISQENRGVSMARNAGIDAAKGEWIAFVDAGDVLREDALEILLKAAVEADAEVSGAQNLVKAPEVGEVMRLLGKAQSGGGAIVLPDPLADIIRYKYICSSVCNKLYRRSAIGELRFQPGIRFEDWPFVTKIFGTIRRFALVKNALYGYVMTPGSATRSGFSDLKIKWYVSGIESVCEFYAKRGALPRAALRRCAIAAGMMLNKVWHARNELPELPPLALSEFRRLVCERKILVWDVPFKTLLRVCAMRNPLLPVWGVATVLWVLASAFFTLCYPVWTPDVVVRYGPMADAFAAGDWEMAFHPRFGVLFQVLAGVVRRIAVFDGLQSCQCVAAGFWAYSLVPLWAVAKKVFGYRTALLCSAFLIVAPTPFGLALDGLRDDGRLFAMLLCAWAFLERRTLAMAAGVFVLLTLRIDSYAIGTVLAAVWCIRAAAEKEWRKILLPAASWAAGTAAVVAMVHHYTGHWVPAIQYIKYLGRWL